MSPRRARTPSWCDIYYGAGKWGTIIGMDVQQIQSLARQLVDGVVTTEQFIQQLRAPMTADLGDVRLDLDRAARCGLPEVIYAEGKPIATLEKIIDMILHHGEEPFLTRVSQDKADILVNRYEGSRYNQHARTLRVGSNGPDRTRRGRVCIISAGTSDLSVAEEARETADWAGTEVQTVYDVGVAGPQRLLEELETIRSADAIVVVAGMEAALASVVGGHVACPVFAVPTSVGYGASLGGMAALLSVLKSCAANVAVVNIDAGFKGGYLAALVARRSQSTE
ncbi:MAG: nickel pincer cofactor biosynthesis protein LarB [Planctomycetales bacterium]